MPELIEIGVDALNPLEVKAGMNPVALKQKYGDKLVFHGGINAVLWSKPDEIRAEIERAALEVYRAYNARDLARVDLIWDGAQARVFEVNVSPGMAERSLFPAACEAAGLSLSSVLNELVTQYAK